MPVASEEKIEQLLRESLREQRVLEQVDKIDLFPTPEGVLAEIVLRDASVLERTRQAVSNAESKLSTEHISLLSTVRALWQIEKIERIAVSTPAGSPPELITALFRATLKSGARLQEAWVAVTPSAQQVLRPLVTSDQAWLELMRAFLGHKLSIGGAGHWDPIRQQKVELSESAARYLRWRPYEALKASIDSVFNPSGCENKRRESVEQFVRSMNFAHGMRKIGRFQDALMDLDVPAAPFSRGEKLPTSNRELYDMLLDSEKQALKIYYLEQVDKAEKDFPNLKAKFPNVFI